MGSTRRMGRLPLALLVVAATATVLIGLVTASPAQAVEGWVVDRLTTDHISDHGAVVRGDDVVWASGEDLTQCKIRWQDLATGTTRTLTDLAYFPLPVLFDGAWVVWQEGWGPDSEIWAYDTAHLGGYRVTNNAVADSGLVLDNGYAAWTHFDGHDYEIYLCHLASGHTAAVTDDSIDQHVLAMRGPLVVWREGGPAPRLVAHDRSSHVSVVLANGTEIDPFIAMDNGVVAWAQSIGGDYEIFVWDPAVGTRQVTSNSVNDRRPSMAGPYLAWVSWTGDTGQEVRLLDLETGATQPLFHGSQIFPPLVRQGRVIWCGRPPGTSDGAVFMWDAKYRRTVRLSSEEWGADNSTVDGGRVAWTAWPADSADSATWEVFTAYVPDFADSGPGDPYDTAINVMQYIGLVSGYQHGSHWDFHPNDPVRRAQFAKMADGMMNLDVSEALVAPFTDLGADDPASLYPHDYVAAAAEHGITLGLSATEFGPYLDISRAQAVTMVIRAIQNLGEPGTLAQPPAVYVGSLGDFDPTHAPAMRMAEYNELLDHLVGYGAGWDPWAPASRGEVAQIIVEAIRLMTVALPV